MKECGQHSRMERLRFNPRFIPRRFTPLSALAPLGAGFSKQGLRRVVGGGPDAGGEMKVRSPAVLASGKLDEKVGMEVDFVGCVFAVTIECPSSSSLSSTCKEVFATVDSIVYGYPAAGGSGGPRDGPSAKFVGLASPRAADGATPTTAPTAVPSDDFVIYRVYLTDVSGACVLLKKRIRPELARHHRILRSAPGACWSIVNACGRDRTESFSSMLGMLPYHDHGIGTVSWSSMTAVGGNGCAPPPRSIGGAPTGHLEQPLLALRRWVEGGGGRNAISRERQRLALLLARERRLGSPGAFRSPSATTAESVAIEQEGGLPPPSRGAASIVAAVAPAVPAAAVAPGEDGDADSGAKHRRASGVPTGTRALLPSRPADDAVIGFVSSFAFLVAFPSPVVASEGQRLRDGGGRTRDDDDDRSLCLNIDNGVNVLAVVLPEASLRMLLELTLGHDNDQPLAIYEKSPTAVSEGGETVVSGDQVARIKPRANETTHDLLDHAIAVLGYDHAVRQEEGAVWVTNREGEPGISTRESAVAAAAAASSTVGEHVAAASPPPLKDGLAATADERQHQREPPPAAISPKNETVVDALVSAVCRISQRGQQHGASCGGVGASSPGVGSVTPPAACSSAFLMEEFPVAAGVEEGSRRAIGTVDDIKRASNAVKVLPLPIRPRVGPDAGGKRGAGDGTTSAEVILGPANPGGAGHCRAAPFVAEPSGGDLECVRRSGGRGGTPRLFFNDLALACGRKQIAFSISRSFSVKLGREVGVVEGVGSVDVAQSTENLLKELTDSHVPPS